MLSLIIWTRQLMTDYRQDQEDEFTRLEKRNSTFTPREGQFEAVDKFIDKCRKDIAVAELSGPTRSNLNDNEQKALKRLRQRKDIVIKPADKGGAVVVWRKDLYQKEAEQQLSNERFYTRLETDRTDEINTFIKSEIDSMICARDLPDTAAALLVEKPKCSNFYILPKIHKPGNPGRPDVSSCSCPTNVISKYLSDTLKPIVRALPIFVKDTNHALNLVRNFRFRGENRLLFTMDIKGLYTNIPNEYGLNALKYFLEKRNVQNPPTHTLLRLAELVLTQNCFKFGDNYYSQTGGTMIGTPFGPEYSCLAVGKQEIEISETYDGPFPEFHKRYIDDILGATSMSRENLDRFINFVSNFHPSFQYTFTVSEVSANFLDIKWYVKADAISTSVYYKETDSHAYLKYGSSHPKSCKNAIPFSQFLRLKRLCSDRQDLKAKEKEMEHFFLARDYPQDIVSKAIGRVSHISRADALKQKEPAEEMNRVILTLTYNSHSKVIKDIVEKNFHIVNLDEEVGYLFQQKPLISYRRDRNIRDMLVHSRFSSKDVSGITLPCGRKRLTCPFVFNEVHTVEGPRGKFTPSGSFSCITKDVIYCIECIQCGEIYIGETERRLGDRIREHLRDVKNKNRHREVAIHFNSLGHSLDHFKVQVLFENINGNLARKIKESYFIMKFGCVYPLGMNRDNGIVV